MRASREIVVEVLKKVFSQEGLPLPEDWDDSLILLDLGLDSLGFAIVVTVLEEKLGWDPFTLSETAFYPKTLGEFVEFYKGFNPPNV